MQTDLVLLAILVIYLKSACTFILKYALLSITLIDSGEQIMERGTLKTVSAFNIVLGVIVCLIVLDVLREIF